MAPVETRFTRPTRRQVVVLIAGAAVAPGPRTGTAALSVPGLRGAAGLTACRRVRDRNRRSGHAVARRLPALLPSPFAAKGPVVSGSDEPSGRRWGAESRARGVCRDPVRSSHGHVVKAGGLRRVTVTLLAPGPWAGRVWALPLLTALAPSDRIARRRGRRHEEPTDWARRLRPLVARGRPGRRVVAVADSGRAAIARVAAVRHHLTPITRLRRDACPADPAPPRRPGTTARPGSRGRGRRRWPRA